MIFNAAHDGLNSRMRQIVATTCLAGALTLTPGMILGAAKENPDYAAWLKSHAVTATTVDAKSTESAEAVFINGEKLTVEGLPFAKPASEYGRLRSRDKAKKLSGVWHAGRCSAGVTIRFVTDSPEIRVRWDNDRAPLKHMASTGSRGVDLYKWHAGKWEFRGVGKPIETTGTTTEVIRPVYNEGDAESKRTASEYLLFLPTYSGTGNVAVGVNGGSHISPAPDRYGDAKPVVFYGTSITQGGCASRAGTGHVALLRRWLDVPVINFGFSGAGKCELSMADTVAEIPASVYVVETVPNMDPGMINKRAVPFFKRLRKLRPSTPILMVESCNSIRNADRNAAWRTAFEKLKADGVKKLDYLSAAHFFDGRENPTVDGVHPTDLGFFKMAEAYEPVLRGLLSHRPEESQSAAK